MKPLESACVLIRAEGRVLLCQRRNRPDQWSLPGGKADSNEWVWDAACRELREETGVSLAPVDLYCFHASLYDGRFCYFFATKDRWARTCPPTPSLGEPPARWGFMFELLEPQVNPFFEIYRVALAHERAV